MLFENEILSIVKEVFAKVLATAKPGVPYETQAEAKLHYYPLYHECCENVEAIKTHCVKGYYPERLFKAPAPNQTDKEAQYIRDNYKQTTLPISIDYDSTIARAWHDNNWSIKYADEDEAILGRETYRSYVESELPKYGSVENFMKNIVPPVKKIEAMGIVVVKPENIKTIVVEDEVRIDDSEKIKPIPVLYGCSQIVAYKEGKYYFVELPENTNVNVGNTTKNIGKVYEVYDDENIYRVEQYGNYTDGTFRVFLFWAHNYGKVPVMRLKGVPVYNPLTGDILYMSPFLYATDILDLALLNAQYLQISITTTAFPYRVMVGDVCEFMDKNDGKCENGLIWNADKNSFYKCPSCDGIGLKSRVSRMGTLLLRPKTRLSEGDTAISEPMKYISPSTDILKFLEEKVDKDEAKGRKILHLRDSDAKVTFTDDTATASNNDLKATHAFVKTVSDQLFEIYEFVLDAIGVMRYGDKFVKPTLSYPKTFDLSTESDYMAEINNAIKVGLPPSIIEKILIRYIRAMYSDSEQEAKIFNLIVQADRLLAISSSQIDGMLRDNTAAAWEKVLHVSALNLVDALIRETPTFLDQDITAQVEQLQKKAQDMAEEFVPEETNIVDELATGS